MEESSAYAQKYLEELLAFFGLNVAVEAKTDDEVIQLDIPSTHLNNHLIGPGANTLRAIQSLLAGALSHQGYACHRVNLDVAGYKQKRLDRLAARAEPWMLEVKESGQPKELDPMNPAERRLIHRLAADHGLASASAGFGRDRYVVISPLDPRSL